MGGCPQRVFSRSLGAECRAAPSQRAGKPKGCTDSSRTYILTGARPEAACARLPVSAALPDEKVIGQKKSFPGRATRTALVHCTMMVSELGRGGCAWAWAERSFKRKITMDLLQQSSKPLSAWQEALLACAADPCRHGDRQSRTCASGGTQASAARIVPRTHGVRLHYSDRGTGLLVLLLHGNAVTGDDYNTSGIAERLVAKYRVIIFDRPGFGSHGESCVNGAWITMSWMHSPGCCFRSEV